MMLPYLLPSINITIESELRSYIVAVDVGCLRKRL